MEQDAEARRELIAAQQKLQSELHQQQSTVAAHRRGLEDERRQIALQRGRDPIVTNAIMNFGLLLACVLPLVVCVMVIRLPEEFEFTTLARQFLHIFRWYLKEPQT